MPLKVPRDQEACRLLPPGEHAPTHAETWGLSLDEHVLLPCLSGAESRKQIQKTQLRTLRCPSLSLTE